jgi:ER-bound oxygenase mpaB/B'/Rubber oxygenase, catalytic domain
MSRIFHGRVSGDRFRPARSLTSADLDPDVQVGDLVSRWNHTFEWDDACIKGKELEKLRWTGDDLCDEVVEFLGKGQGDLLAQLENYTSSNPREKWDLRVERFMDSVEKNPPPSIDSTKGHYSPNFEQPSEPLSLSRGQEVFWKYNVGILTSLIHFSLVGKSVLTINLTQGGFSAPRIIEVLMRTSYLTGSSREVTNRRLFETLQMILDAMTDMTPPSANGFCSVLRVRMLHSQVRIRLRNSSRYDVEKYGVPINQEDLLATLGAFSVACVWSMERMNIRLSEEEKESYIMAWRHIGYYMGIDPAYLERFYYNYHTAEKHLCSTIAHLLEPEFGKPSGMLPLQLLGAISNRPLFGHSLQYHAELSRLLIGDDLANIFQLPRGDHWTQARLWTNLTLIRLQLWFGSWYRPGWERTRVFVMKEISHLTCMWQVGERQGFERTHFGYKMPVGDGTDEMENNNKRKENDPVSVDREHIKEIKRLYYRVVIGEPVLLVMGCVGCAITLTFWNWRRY